VRPDQCTLWCPILRRPFTSERANPNCSAHPEIKSHNNIAHEATRCRVILSVDPYPSAVERLPAAGVPTASRSYQTGTLLPAAFRAAIAVRELQSCAMTAAPTASKGLVPQCRA